MFGTTNAVINNLLNNIFNALWFYMLTTKLRFNKTKTILLVCLAAVISEVISLYTILDYGSGKNAYMFLYIVANLIYVLFYIFIMQKEKLLKSVFIFFAFVFMWISVYSIVIILTDYLFNGYEPSVWILRSVFNTVLLLAYHNLCKRGFMQSRLFMEKPSAVLLLISGMVYLMLPVLMIFYVYDAEKNIITLGIIGFSLIFCTVVYILMFRFINQVGKERKTQAIEAQNKILIEALKNAEEFEKQARRMRHDSRHQAELLIGFARTGNTDAIIKHLQGRNSREAEADSIRYCSNDTVDMILRSYTQKAKANNIEIITDIRMNEETTIADEDLISILGNMLENAINGCMKVPTSRKLEISIYHKSIKLVLICKNTCTDNILFENGIPKRSAGKGDGIGTTSIMMSADRYNGEVVFNAEDGIFICGVILNDYK